MVLKIINFIVHQFGNNIDQRVVSSIRKFNFVGKFVMGEK